MPHVRWNVETNSFTYQKDLSGLEGATSSKLVAVLKQLACVVYVANRVFGDICVECRDLNSRTDRLRSRLENCSLIVKSLNAKTVPVPVGDLTKVREIKQHFQTYYDKETNLFMPDTRPKCLEKLYQQATATTQFIIQPDSTYCSDSETYPMTYSDTISRHSDADIDSRRPSSCYSKRELKVRDTSHADDLSYFSEDEWCSKSALQQKPWHQSPDEEMHTELLNYPSSVVPIDVTGSNFQKMSTFRRSLIHFDFLVKRKKKKKNRRNIIVIKKDCNNIEGDCPDSKNVSIPKRTKSPNRTSDCSVKLVDEKISHKNEMTIDVKAKKEVESIANENLIQPHSGKIDSFSRCTANKVEKTTGSRKTCGFLPISTLSAAMSVAVNLRGTSVATKLPENGHSTSGTIGSDRYRFTRTNSSSKSSLGKDSTVSENRPSDRSQDGTLTGYTSDSSATTNTTAPLGRQRSTSAGQSEGSFSDSNMDSSSDHLHKPLTKSELKQVAHDNDQSVGVNNESYVKLQNDCQKQLTSPGYETDSSNSFGSVKSYSSCTSVSTIGNNSLNSLLSQTATELSSDSSSLIGISKLPPLPPLRNSSRISNDNLQIKNSDTLHISNLQQGLSDNTEKIFPNARDNDAKNYYQCTNYNQIRHSEEKNDRSQLDRHSDIYQKANYPQCTSNYQSQQKDVYRSFQPVNTNKPPLRTFFPLKETPKNVGVSQSISNCTKSVNTNTVTEDQIPKSIYSDTNYLMPQRVQLDDEKSSIPSKYAHHVIVTPVVRPKKTSAMQSSLLPENNDQALKNSIEIDETYFHGVQRNARDYSSLRCRKSAARTLLESNETVIFPSNSLGRRRDGHPLNYIPSFTTPEKKYATLPFSQHPSSPVSHYGAYVKLQPDGKIACCNTVPRIRNSSSQNPALLKTINKDLYSSESHSSSKTVHHVSTNADDLSVSPLNRENEMEYVCNNQPQSDSPLPIYSSCKELNDSLVHNNKCSNSIQLLDTEEQLTDSNNKLQLDNSKSPVGRKTHLTSENLFALIHSSKKRHNIKTEIDVSPLPSRSCSPQCKSQAATVGIECGFLSPGQPREKNIGSKYQNGSVIHSSSKSTSIQEFKMLLLQTKNHNLNNSPSKSAAEQLKATAQAQKQVDNDNRSMLDSLSLSCHRSTYVLPSTVPLKRGSRARASLPVRRECPPIWEDHSEETEADRKCFMHSALMDPMTKSTSEITASSAWLPPHSSSAWV